MKKESLFHKDFIILIIGQFISLFGNSLQRFALSLYILDITGSAAIFSVILSLTIFPQIILAPFGGAIADRFSKKNIMVFLDTFSGLFLLLFALYSRISSSSSLIFIGILMCLLAIIQSIYDPSVRASVPAITLPKNLSQANSAVSIVTSLTSLAGPIAAGFIYGIYGIQTVFIINIISFLLSAAIELFLVIPQTTSRFSGSLIQTFLGDIKETFFYLFHEKRLIFYMILVSCSLNLFLTPIYTVGVPFIEKIVFGVSNQLYGISEGCMGAGMIIGALFVGILSKKLSFQKFHYYFIILAILIIGMGICTLPFLCNTNRVCYLSYILFTIIGFLFAFILAIINITCMTFMQLEIPIQYMGKAMALVTSLATALMPIGQIIFGGLYDSLSTMTYLIYFGVALLSLLATIGIYRLLHSSLFTIISK